MKKKYSNLILGLHPRKWKLTHNVIYLINVFFLNIIQLKTWMNLHFYHCYEHWWTDLFDANRISGQINNFCTKKDYQKRFDAKFINSWLIEIRLYILIAVWLIIKL